MRSNRTVVVRALREKLNVHMRTTGKARMEKALERYREEVLKVIYMYNTFQIERFTGDSMIRVTRGYANDPLINTRKYLQGWKWRIKYISGNKVIGVLYNNVYYAYFLEEGTMYMSPFRIGKIAFQQCKQDIKFILEGRDR